ncbi:MAG: HD domain-containing phosphohydrolase [Thermodesulfovibrionales bacterium]
MPAFLRRLQNLSLETKFIGTLVLSVTLAIVILTALIIRRENMIFRAEYEKNAETVASVICGALKDNMLSGRPEDTVRLLSELSPIDGIKGLGILKTDGANAFQEGTPLLQVDDHMLQPLRKGEITQVSLEGTQFYLRPLLNEQRCHSCHAAEEKIRGIVVIKLASAEKEHSIADLTGRMAVFGLFTSISLSSVLILFSRRMVLSPVRSLTEATRKIAGGEYVFFKPRGTRCYEINCCGNTGCAAYGDETIPCWLRESTPCNAIPGGKKPEACFTCAVYKSQKGDEITQLIDNHNRMSLTLSENDSNRRRYIGEIETLNQELLASNKKLGTLLEASRDISASLDLDQTLRAALKLLAGATGMEAGMLLFVEEDLTKRCHEFFDCDAYHCPAYKRDTNCWRVPGTMCIELTSSQGVYLTPRKFRGEEDPHTHYDPALSVTDKIGACSGCDFLSTINLIPKMAVGIEAPEGHRRLKLKSSIMHRAFVTGRALMNYTAENPLGIPLEIQSEVVIPLKVQDEVAGIVYLASGSRLYFGKDELSFLQSLAEVISSGLFNSRLFEEMGTSYFQTVMALSNAVEAKDPYTRGHSERVAVYSLRAAEALNLGRQEIEHLRFAAILHDIGKISIRVELLRKDSGLDDSERQMMMSHPESGVRILEPVAFLRPALPAILHHHERLDGSGYPHGLKGKQIPLKARILCVADALDAMLSDRSYRKALSVEAAKAELRRHAGAQFDQEVVDFFLSIL